MLTALLDSLYRGPPFALGTVPLAGGVCAPRAFTSDFAAGKCEGVTCFSVVTQPPSLHFPPLVLFGVFTAC